MRMVNIKNMQSGKEIELALDNSFVDNFSNEAVAAMLNCEEAEKFINGLEK